MKLVASIAAILAVVLLAGCGSGGGGSGGGGKAATTTSANGKAPQTANAAKPRKPIGPPPDRESLKEAEKRISAAVSSNDCAKINSLNPVSIPQLDTSARCNYLKRLGGDANLAGGQEFKNLAAVLDYTTPQRKFSVILLRDVDGLYHVLSIDPFLKSGTVGTPFAQQFDAAAKQAFDALKAKDCNAYYDVAYRLSGVGSLPKDKVCPHVEQNPIAGVLENDPSAEPKPIGGNAYFAFYGLDTPQAFLTMVMLKQSTADRPSGLPKGAGIVPKGAAEYAYFGSYRTNLPNPPSG